VTRANRIVAARARRGRSRTIEVDPGDTSRVAEYKKGAVDYADNLPEWAREELYRKPFCTFTEHVEPVVLVYFRDLADLLELANLPAGASILDVACGPGWLSESLYRFGYRVTGVDIAEGLLTVARERIRSLPRAPLNRDPSWIEFRSLDIETERLDRKFDAAVLYDCLHHFVDAAGALANIRSMLSEEGVLLIKEGTMPPPGSRAEHELLAESETYTTLEAPFDPRALEELLRAAGFADVRRYFPGHSLVAARRSVGERLRDAFRSLAEPPVNFFVCRPGGAGPARATPPWRARIEKVSARAADGGAELVLRVTNEGRLVWTAGDTERTGTVCLGCRLFAPDGRKLDELSGRTPIPRDVAPGESLELTVLYPWPDSGAPGARLSLDLVSQGRFWFSRQGSPQLELELPARG
jgi:SAM-dependent methyltransferase